MSDADGSVSHRDQSKPQSTCELTESETDVSHSDHHCTNHPGFGNKTGSTADHGPHRDSSGDESSMFAATTEATAYCLAGCFIGKFIGLALGVTLGFKPIATITIATVLGFASVYRWSGWPRLTWQRETISIAMFLFAVNVTDCYLGGVAAWSVLGPQFWLSYLLALPVGFIATWPVNW